MTMVNELTKQNQKYVQKGGFLMIITKIGEFLLWIVMKLIEFIMNLFRIMFMIRIDSERWYTLFLTIDTGEGLFYKFLWFSIKCGFFLVVFAFGGPLLTLVGISFMYKNLFKKMKELKKDDDEGEEGEGKDEGGGDAGESNA